MSSLPNSYDLTGMVFNHLTALEPAGKKGTSNLWKCSCVCGNITLVTVAHLMSAHTQSCGCIRKEKAIKNSIGQLEGKRFGRLIVTRRAPEKDTRKKPAWECLCDCGNVVYTTKYRLESGQKKSCGCYLKDWFLSRRGDKGYTFLGEGISAKNEVIANYKTNAAKRGYSWNLEDEVVIDLFASNCHYCGALPSNKGKTSGGVFTYSGIDRKDNNIGYEEGNVVSACFRCNKAKMEMSYDDFLDHINIIAKLHPR